MSSPFPRKNHQQFILALILSIAVIGFLYAGSIWEWIDKEVMMFMLGSITTAFILSIQFYFRRAEPQ
jgi:hypothetical protein